MRGEFVDTDNKRIYYYAAGTRNADERPPVLLLHGFPLSSRLWHLVARDFPDGHRLIVCDLPGFGRSEALDPYTDDAPCERSAEAIRALLDELGVARAGIVAHGTSGGIAQALAVRHPDRVSHLALVASTGFGVRPRRLGALARALEPLTRAAPSGVLAGLVHGSARRGFADPDRTDLSLDACLRPFADRAGRAVLARHLRALARDDGAGWSARLGELRMPALVACGRDDPFLPLSLGERLAAAIPGARLEVIDGARHFVPEDTPDQLIRHLATLLAS
jgi:pimeloyl-ACP methyl ester carboxylesterase